MDRSYFPLFVDISGKKTLVVGGGRIAWRRIKTLLSFTPDIWVVAPEATEELEALAEEGRIHWIQGTYAPGIMKNCPDPDGPCGNRRSGLQRSGGQRVPRQGDPGKCGS